MRIAKPLSDCKRCGGQGWVEVQGKWEPEVEDCECQALRIQELQAEIERLKVDMQLQHAADTEAYESAYARAENLEAELERLPSAEHAYAMAEHADARARTAIADAARNARREALEWALSRFDNNSVTADMEIREELEKLKGS